jgi:hypothetical protein
MSDAESPRFLVQCLEGTWYIGWPEPGQPIESREWLQDWLGARGASRGDLDFGSDPDAALQFIQEFGPLD